MIANLNNIIIVTLQVIMKCVGLLLYTSNCFTFVTLSYFFPIFYPKSPIPPSLPPFFTYPSLSRCSTQIYLPEFLRHIPDPVPCKARLYMDCESEEPLPDFLINEDISMTRRYVETSIIASPMSEEDLEHNTTSEGTETEDIPIT